MKDKKELTFSDLWVRYGTGRAYTISGTGRNRVTGYRTGMMCDAGDIEVSEWCQLVKDAIARAGEQTLYSQLLEFVKENYFLCKTKPEQERKALDLHASRIFDNEEWVSYVTFNQKYRPEVLDLARLRTVKSACCGKPGLVTQAMIDRHSRGERKVACPICGKFSSYEFAEEEFDLLSA